MHAQPGPAVPPAEAPSPVEAPPPAPDEPAPDEPAPDPKPETQEEIYAVQQAVAISGWDPRADAHDWMIAPADTLRLGLENVLVSAGGDLTPLLATPELAITDLVLLRLSAGYSIGGSVELMAGLTLVPKQPIATGAPVFEGAGIGARVGLASAWATTLALRAGPTIDGSRAWLDGAWTLDGRYRADRHIVFEGNAGVGATGVSFEDGLGVVAEALVGGDAILQEPKRAALSAGIGFAFPFWSRDHASAPLDPQSRVDVHAVGVISLADEWDVWLRAAVIDRGEVTAPSSVLPILDGGFDQQQLTLGVTYRSESREPDFTL